MHGSHLTWKIYKISRFFHPWRKESYMKLANQLYKFKAPGLSVPVKIEQGTVETMVDEGSIASDPLATTVEESGILPTTSVQSVIQQNQQSVIQTGTNMSLQLPKGNVILMKPNSVIQTASGSLHMLQAVDGASDESMSNEDDGGVKKRREILARRPSYRKILNELGGGEIADYPGIQLSGEISFPTSLDKNKGASPTTSESSQDNDHLNSVSISGNTYQTAGLLKGMQIIPGGTIQIATSGTGEMQSLQTLTMTNATTGGAIVQYAQSQDGQFFVPAGVVVSSNTGASPIHTQHMAEDVSRKREMRLLKNREAARECRRKKKEYIKCLENRVAVLENQNKALIEELKSLKELYCQQKTD